MAAYLLVKMCNIKFKENTFCKSFVFLLHVYTLGPAKKPAGFDVPRDCESTYKT